MLNSKQYQMLNQQTKIRHQSRNCQWVTSVSFAHSYELLLKISCTIIIISDHQILATRQAKKAYFICFVAYTLSYLCGINVIRDFVSEIFQQTDTVISVKNSSLVISSVAFAGNLLCLTIIERFARRVIHLQFKCYLLFECTTFLIVHFSKQRAYSLDHRLWPLRAILHLPFIVTFGSITPNSNGCHYFALPGSYFSVHLG